MFTDHESIFGSECLSNANNFTFRHTSLLKTATSLEISDDGSNESS